MANNPRRPLSAEEVQQKEAEIRARFRYKSPTPRKTRYFDRVTQGVDALVETILDIPDGQERAVALTQLQLARMAINAAIANSTDEALESWTNFRSILPK